MVDSLGRKHVSLNLAARDEFIAPDGKEEGTGGGAIAYNAPWRGWVTSDPAIEITRPISK